MVGNYDTDKLTGHDGVTREEKLPNNSLNIHQNMAKYPSKYGRQTLRGYKDVKLPSSIGNILEF